MAKYIESKKKPVLFKLIRKSVRVFYRKRKYIGLENIPDEPVIFISNHAQMHGPLASELFFPRKKYIWCIGQVMNIKEAPKYNFNDFWAKKPKYIRWFYKIASYVTAPISAYVFSRADTIPVYKDSRVMSTFKETVKQLDSNHDIIIFPECSTRYNDIINEFQDKFIDVARLYYKRCQKEISFVPMYNAAKLRTIVIGEPIKFNASLPIEEQRKTICDFLKEQITTLAKDLPVHKVIPYANVGRKNYTDSK